MNHQHDSSSLDHRGFTHQAVSATNRDVKLLRLSRSSLLPCVSTHRFPVSSRTDKSRRVLFALNIKYLLEILKSLREDALLQNTKNVVATCTRLNRMRDPGYTPLENVVESSLRSLVGNLYWEMAQERARQHLKRQYSRRCATSTAVAYAKLQARHNTVSI
jgi:hypothetical protein